MPPFSGRPRRRRGFGLVELLIALTLGLFLVAGIVALFATNKATYSSQQGISRVQENARFAVHRLVKDIRLAGYSGCLGGSTPYFNTLSEPNTYLNDFSRPLQGYTRGKGGGWSPAAPGVDLDHIVDNTDVLTLRIPLDLGAAVTQSMTSPNDSPIQIRTPPAPFKPGKPAMISSCTGGTSVFRVGSYTAGAVGTNKQNLQAAYRAGAIVQRVATVTYFIADDGDGPALWKKKGSGNVHELVKGVDNIQIRYDIGPDRQNQTATQVAGDWNRVTSVHLALLVSSIKQAANKTGKESYALLGRTINISPPDHRLRRVFKASATLRNRVR